METSVKLSHPSSCLSFLFLLFSDHHSAAGTYIPGMSNAAARMFNRARKAKQAREFINAHNTARESSGVPPLGWDKGLARFADKWAKQRRRGWPERVVMKWFEERFSYDSKTNSCASGEMCGHYTQIVWRDTTAVGCARVKCDEGRGFLVVCEYNPRGITKIVKAFRNLPGVELCHVERLNLLKLAPGGHLGRFVVWTKSAFEKLEGIYGSFEKGSEKKKRSVVRPIEKDATRKVMKKNPLKNLNVMLKLNPYAKTAKRMSLLAEAERVKAKKEKLTKKRKTVTKEESLAIKAAGKSWYQTMISDSDYTEFDNFTKWLGASHFGQVWACSFQGLSDSRPAAAVRFLVASICDQPQRPTAATYRSDISQRPAFRILRR
ncbi:hypothetical protein F2Q70_00009745, partial [Brassica cretica]